MCDENWLKQRGNQFLSLADKEMRGKLILKNGDNKNTLLEGLIEKVARFDNDQFICFVKTRSVPRKSISQSPLTSAVGSSNVSSGSSSIVL